MKKDYLKYWKVIREFTKKKYNISQADLDMLLFLYSEEYFSHDDFTRFNKLLTWNKKRFYNLMNEKWIEKFRERNGKKKTLYTITYKCRRVIGDLYKRLEGEEIPETGENNPMFLKGGNHRDMLYKNYIIKMNEATRQRRYDALE